VAELTSGCAPSYTTLRDSTVQLWVPEVGGPVDPGSEAHDLVMTLFGGMSKGERTRVKTRVRAAMSAQTATEGRFAHPTATSWSTPASTSIRARPPSAPACTGWNPTRPPPRS
jgi:hypothetical protein